MRKMKKNDLAPIEKEEKEGVRHVLQNAFAGPQ